MSKPSGPTGATGATGTSVIPWTQLYLNLDVISTVPLLSSADTFPNNPYPNTISHTSTSYQAIPVPNVLVTSFVTPVGFLTSTTIPGGVWIFSQWAKTTDTGELNNFYISICSVDADGISNPSVILDGSTATQLLSNSSVQYNYVFSQSVASSYVVDLTKRIRINVYANFGVASSIVFAYEGTTTSSVLCPIPHSTVQSSSGVVGPTGLTGITGTTGATGTHQSAASIDIGSLTLYPTEKNQSAMKNGSIMIIPLHYKVALMAIANIWVTGRLDSAASTQLNISSGPPGERAPNWSSWFTGITPGTLVPYILGTSSIDSVGYENGFSLVLSYIGSATLPVGSVNVSINDLC